MSVIDEVRAEREDLARVLKRHMGIRKIVEDLYPDRAHFIFELLQNAEDRGATEVRFELSATNLRFEHNGETFRPQDIFAITDIGEGTKAGDEDKIGRFGVGFKSVFAYSETPHIWSPTFSFKISGLVLPSELPPAPDLAGLTRFDFPFNNPKKTPADAYKEIASGLDELVETTLLFLRHIETIQWHVGVARSGTIMRVEHDRPHVEVLKQLRGKTTTSSHFLKFDQSVPGLATQRTAVAFALDFLPGVSAFAAGKPLSHQLRIVPTAGQVAVFFPAAKETSGLRFHLHAPFVPELSRASVKETPANKPLFDQLAQLTANSLHTIRDMGLLTVEFLGVLPNTQDQLSPRYVGILNAVMAAMNAEPLTPTYAKRHAPARSLLQARASLKELLDPQDLNFLVDHDGDAPQWAATATQRNSNADRLLAALEITDWGIEEFVKYLADRTTGATYYVAQDPDSEAMAWLASKPADWHQALYSLLQAEATDEIHRLEDCQIVRLATGEYSVGRNCFFPDEKSGSDDPLPRVDITVYTSGKSVTQHQNARKFLEEIGVRTAGEAEQIEIILNKRYTREAQKPGEKTYIRDLRRFAALVEKEPACAAMFHGYYVFRCEHGQWRQPAEVYLDTPFDSTGLRAFHDARGERSDKMALAPEYKTSGIPTKRLATFARAAGAQVELVLTRITTYRHSQSSVLRADYHRAGVRRTDSMIDVDWTIDGLDDALNVRSEALSLLVWRTMCSAEPQILEARFRPNQQYATKRAPSSLVLLLQGAEWIPQGNGEFVKPSGASQDRLPDGFAFDRGQAWLKAVNWGEEIERQSELERRKDELAKELGFENQASLERAKRFASLPPEEQERILAMAEPPSLLELPEHEPSNSERRRERVVHRAQEAPVRRTETRERTVSMNRDAVKVETDEYLRTEYTKDDEQFCQVCKAPLPFKLDDGSFFFEAVELLPELNRHHHQNYLCLCPNHSAMFRHTNGSKLALLKNAILTTTNNEVPVVLARENASIYFTKAHLADLKAILATETEVDALE